MRRRITLLVVTALTAAAMALGPVGAAFADSPKAGGVGSFQGQREAVRGGPSEVSALRRLKAAVAERMDMKGRSLLTA
jgi:hypothetical protein